MLTVTTLTLPRKPAPPKETRIAPRPHVRMEQATYAVPLRRTRPVPPETDVSAEIARRVRGGHTYCAFTQCEYSWDAYEARSGLAGHPA